jgi:hypothetical protein
MKNVKNMYKLIFQNSFNQEICIKKSKDLLDLRQIAFDTMRDYEDTETLPTRIIIPGWQWELEKPYSDMIPITSGLLTINDISDYDGFPEEK